MSTNKKILYIHQYFKTPDEPGGTRSYWFSIELIKNGYDVIMITSRPKQKKLIEKHIIDGIEVIYIKNFYSNNMGILRRMIAFFSFMIKSAWIALFQRDIHLVFATSTPLTVGIPALLMKWIRRVPYVFEVRDLWPEVPIQMGALRNPLLRKLALILEKSIYQNAIHIIALSPGMKDGVINKGIEASKVSMIPNMSKIDKFWQRPKNKLIAEKFNIDLKKMNVIHFGAMGKANGLEYILRSAEHLKNMGINSINFIFMGKGAVKKNMIFIIKEKSLTNVQIIDAQPMGVVSEIVNLCDVSMVPFANIPILQTNSPNKLFDSLSAGIPVIVNSAGWTKDLLEKYSCGVYVDPDNPQELADTLIKWSRRREKVLEMGRNSRELAEKVYDKSILSKKFVSIMDKLL
ncbi:MAG: glycosyltransferase family 4 protein [Bacteroidales bacterium]|jgi:glycosyltransferase involved in cell wall biosynthesis|nr:glycosyltransferase family 4 protein [Bacteroidales bacterium]